MRRYYALGAILIAGLLSGCSDSTDSLIKRLKSDNASLRVIAQDGLIKRKDDPAAVKKVVALLNDGDDRIVFIALQALGEMRDSTTIAPLCHMAENPNPVFRAEAVRSLGKIGIDSVWTAIEQALADTSKEVRGSAVTALGVRSDLSSLPKVYGMLHDPAPSVRAAAVQALYSLSAISEAGIKALSFQKAVRDSFNVVRYVAAQALGKAYPDTVIAAALLLSLLEDQDKNVRVEAIRSLGIVHGVKAVPILKKNFVYSTYEEQEAISKTIKMLTGEEFPKPK
ncbi:MAG: HEAT repeat domain-containing protein [Candidatus Latescibacterota bacterium]